MTINEVLSRVKSKTFRRKVWGKRAIALRILHERCYDVSKYNPLSNTPPSYTFSVCDLQADDWYIVSEPAQAKTVYLWRYKNEDQKHWKVAKSLLTEDEAIKYFMGCSIAKYGVPIEVIDEST